MSENSSPRPDQMRESLPDAFHHTDAVDADRLSLDYTKSDMIRVYRSQADSITQRERRLAAELPIETPYGLESLLERVMTDWMTGRKSCRTVPVMNAYNAIITKPMTDGFERILVGLDAHINILDDIIDTPEPTVDTRIHYAFNATISNRLVWQAVPRDLIEVVDDFLTEYLVTIFQIPAVEQELLERFKMLSSLDERVEIARQIYAYRAKAMTAFAELPAIVLEIEDSVAERVVDDLVSIRARQLLFKDIRDVERDLRDGDETPVLKAMRQQGDPARVANLIEMLRKEFPLSTAGDEAYGDAMRTLEGRPADLPRLLSEQMNAMDRGKFA